MLSRLRVRQTEESRDNLKVLGAICALGILLMLFMFYAAWAFPIAIGNWYMLPAGWNIGAIFMYIWEIL